MKNSQFFFAILTILLQSAAIIFSGGKMSARLEILESMQKSDIMQHTQFVNKADYDKEYTRLEQTIIRMDQKLDRILENYQPKAK